MSSDTTTISTPLTRSTLEASNEQQQQQEQEREEDVGSMCSSSCSSEEERSSLSPKSERRLRSSLKPHLASKVAFANLEIREYSRTVGDHPGTFRGGSRCPGPPISLDWDHQRETKVSIKEYEETRGPRRSKEQLALAPQVRKQMLVEEWGHSVQELKQAERKCAKVVNQRQLTFAMLPWSEVEEVAQSISRKTKRLVHKAGRSNSNNTASSSPDWNIPVLSQSEHGTTSTEAHHVAQQPTSILVTSKTPEQGRNPSI